METVSNAPPVRVRRATTRKTDRARVPFRDRYFIAWDGEGATDPGTDTHKYILFGCSQGDTIQAPNLKASQCFELLMMVARKYPNSIHVAFAFDYDVTMMCRSLPLNRREQLVTTGVTWFNHYRIEWRPKKWFTLTDRETGTRIQIYDVFTFFACSALKAWEQYLPEEPALTQVVEGKSARDSFTYTDIAKIREYMMLELDLYVKLVTKLRTLLTELEVFPNGWYGPGAVASATLRKQGIKRFMDPDLTAGVIQASQHAYFGGRFEQFYAGRYEGPVYTYDIRSAYPHALRTVPQLSGGIWHHRERVDWAETPLLDFSLYRVRYRQRVSVDSLWSPSPLPYRDRRFSVHYPNSVSGWYWGVEINALISTLQPGDDLCIEDAYEFVPATHETPFAFLAELYKQRRRWKDEGQAVQLAAKLIMNSMYGKLAQRVGHKNGKPPSWHQLEWAGYTTAYCRAMIQRAIAQDPHAIIAVETDGLFSMRPLNLGPDTGELGTWEKGQLSGLIYVQSGVYWKASQKPGTPLAWSKPKVRGFAPGDVQLSAVMDSLPSLSPLRATVHRFHGIKATWNKPHLATWMDQPREIVWGGGGKRHHNEELCAKCQGANIAMHPLTISYPNGGISQKHVLPWRDDNINPWWLVEDVEREREFATFL